MSSGYRRYDSEFQPKNQVGAAYLKDRRSCGSDTACIAAVQARALETYGARTHVNTAIDVVALMGVKKE